MGSSGKLLTIPDRDLLHVKFGVKYFEPNVCASVEAEPNDLYFYSTYVGKHKISITRGDSVYYISENKTEVFLNRGPIEITSFHLATVIRGYMPENKSSTITTRTNLPYVNGCSTKQLFPPERLGDPTLQMLYMPPYSSEQAHHIHSTVRVVYILKGKGRCIVGMNKQTVTEELYPGKICILQAMCPHHFETSSEYLVALPLHIFSSVGSQEFSHPMFNGTHLVY